MTVADPFGWIGATIDGRYAVDGVAGEGAFAVVYRGRHLSLDEPVAIKCLKIPPQLTGRDRNGLLSAFRAEARTLHRLSRRTAAIVQALDLGAATAPGGAWTPYIVMEWLDGETLHADLEGRRARGELPRSIDEAMLLLAPAAHAIAIAHAEGIVHRDLKPSNLFLARTRDETMLKVLDFGIARILSETQVRSTGSDAATGLVAFTPQYAAPEQFHARYGQTGPWTDVFSLALVLLELCSHRPALVGTDLVQLYVAAVDEAHRPSLSALGIEVPPAVDAVLRRAVAVAPEARFADVGGLWSALEEAVAGAGVVVPLDGPADSPVAFDPTLLAGSAGEGTLRLPRSAPPASAEPTKRDAPIASTTARSPLAPRPVPTAWRAGPATGENRVCTVVATSIEGLSSLADRLEPDQIQEVLDHCVAAATARLVELGGTVVHAVSGEITAVFGAPTASDNDAERAVHAALGVQAALATVTLPGRALRGFRPTGRVGIGTGRVFAGHPTSGRAELTVTGDALKLAARLRDGAGAGGVVMGGSTHRQIAGLFEVEPLVAGPLDTATAFRVLRPAPTRALVADIDFLGVPTQLVGRSAEVVRLSEAIDAVRADGHAQILTLVGPTGVGKTRLLVEATRLLGQGAPPFAVLTAQASPLASERSHGLLDALLRAGFQLQEDDPPAEIARKLLRGLRALAGGDVTPTLDDAADVAAEIAAALGQASVEDTASRSRASPSEGGAARRHRLAAAVARVVEAVATERPVAIVVDDLQWTDDASLDLIDELVLRLADRPLLVLASARPTLFERRPHWGEGKTGHRRLEIEPLGRRHIEQMARDRLGRVPDLSTTFVGRLAERAEGSALVLVETLHLLVDMGVVEVAPSGRWQVHEERLGALELPPTIQGVVQARLDRLGRPARLVLERAAVIGRTFWRGALEALGADAPDEAVAVGAVLAELRERRLVGVREASSIAGEDEWCFTEAATQEVAYGTLSVRARRPMHRVVARWLSARMRGDALAGMCAHHHERAGDLAAAAASFVRAGAHAAALGHPEQALIFYERARKIHDDAAGAPPSEPTVALTDERDEGRVAGWRDRARLRLDLGDVLRALGRLDDAERVYDEARERVLRREQRTSERLEVPEAALWDSRADFRCALSQKVRGATGETRRLVERAIAGAVAAGASEETPAMWALLASVDRRLGDNAGWRHACLEGLRVCRGIVARDARFWEAVSTLLVTLGGLFYSTGRLVRAERLYRQAARVLDEATQPQAVGAALSDAGAVRFARGDIQGARELFVRALRLKERAGDLLAIAIALSNLAEVELRLGDGPGALAHARRSVALGERVDARSDLPDMLKNLALALHASGDAEGALVAGGRALGLAREGGGRVYLPDVALAVAGLCGALSGAAPAVALRAALDAALVELDPADAARCRARLAGVAS